MSETVEYGGKSFPVDDEGFLIDPSLFCPEWVDLVMESEEIEEMTEDHHQMINCLRDYQAKHGHPPRVRDMTEVTGFKMKYIYELFPSGPGKGACKMAGLSKPSGCV
jgi:tRNA 2-thiouridine synthesizing protein E